MPFRSPDFVQWTVALYHTSRPNDHCAGTKGLLKAANGPKDLMSTNPKVTPSNKSVYRGHIYGTSPGKLENTWEITMPRTIHIGR